jgi:hypothetical protein
MPPAQYRLTLQAEQDPIDPILRLRALLKRALRDYKIRCIRIERIADEDENEIVGQN